MIIKLESDNVGYQIKYFEAGNSLTLRKPCPVCGAKVDHPVWGDEYPSDGLNISFYCEPCDKEFGEVNMKCISEKVIFEYEMPDDPDIEIVGEDN